MIRVYIWTVRAEINRKDQAMRNIFIPMESSVDFPEAKRIAESQAKAHLTEPMVLSWLEKESGRHWPDVECCGDECHPAWEIYGETRGGSVRVDVGKLYSFILREGATDIDE
jgi:hypothetical protein